MQVQKDETFSLTESGPGKCHGDKDEPDNKQRNILRCHGEDDAADDESHSQWTHTVTQHTHTLEKRAAKTRGKF